MAGLGDLSKRLREHGETISVNLNKKTKGVARAIDTLIVKAMPVDTGRARSAVVVTVGEPSFIQTSQAYVPGSKGSTSGANTQAAIDQAESALRDRELGEEIHININIPYIDDLNRGYSPQASPGFIQQAITDGVSTESGVSVLEK
ncbi:MAG: hypothetical protein K2Q14_07010 [Gammaproteobacteria bacterium]|nr:hypothetical protein [Nitrosomonas sp.]MBY0545277.1 hypothetical protein [Gammaproteobacteria bacterium]